MITIVLANEVKIENIRSTLASFNVDLIPRKCSEELLTIRKNSTCFSLFNRHCDCNSPIGLLSRKDLSLPKSKLKNLRKNPNITEDEIKRLNEQKKLAIIDDPEIKLLHDLLRDLLSKGVRTIGLFIHWDSDPLKFKEEIQIHNSKITNVLLASLKEDILYEFITS